MDYLVTGKEMKAYDTYTIEHIGIDALVLMERAALKITECVDRLLKDKSGKVLCICGMGNNGGDGLCVARLLTDRGIETEVVLVGDRKNGSREVQVQLSILEKYGIVFHSEIPKGEYAILVDALFGIGLSRNVTGIYEQAIHSMNEKKALRISVDIPSGIDADTGRVFGVAVRADETVTLAFEKRGLYLYPGSLYAGKISLADIGITKRSFQENTPIMYTLKEAPGNVFPKRRPDGNKGTFGKLLLVAGSEEMAGAAILSGSSAFTAGAGMVKLVVPEKIRSIIQDRLPESMIQIYNSSEKLIMEEEEAFLENLNWADAVAIGPGLSVCESGRRFLFLTIKESKKPLIIDADGINLLAADEKLRKLLEERSKFGNNVIITPHMGELATLLRKSVKEVVEDETESALKAAEDLGCIVVAKSARTHVCKTGSKIFLNTAGNDKMATAGSGDVLTGIIGAFAAQGQEPLQAAVKGVYLHACAGDAAGKLAGNAGIKASDIMEGLKLL